MLQKIQNKAINFAEKSAQGIYNAVNSERCKKIDKTLNNFFRALKIENFDKNITKPTALLFSATLVSVFELINLKSVATFPPAIDKPAVFAKHLFTLLTYNINSLLTVGSVAGALLGFTPIGYMFVARLATRLVTGRILAQVLKDQNIRNLDSYKENGKFTLRNFKHKAEEVKENVVNAVKEQGQELIGNLADKAKEIIKNEQAVEIVQKIADEVVKPIAVGNTPKVQRFLGVFKIIPLQSLKSITESIDQAQEAQ